MMRQYPLAPYWHREAEDLRVVPDNVHATLAQVAEEHRQSLSAFVVDRLTEIAQVMRIGDYVASYIPPGGTGYRSRTPWLRSERCGKHPEPRRD
jgi:hypothetical protein